MKIIIILTAIIVTQSGFMQTAEAASKSLSSTMDVHVFPADGQAEGQQSKDEAECYKWATNKTGTDPFDLSKESKEQAKASEQAKAKAETAGQGAGASGAIKGAAAGAIIGEITDNDHQHDAKVGAALGLIKGRRSARKAKEQAVEKAENNEQKQQQQSSEKLKSFKNAFSVCLEAKKYMVKF